jgi:hypothetical protein
MTSDDQIQHSKGRPTLRRRFGDTPVLRTVGCQKVSKLTARCRSNPGFALMPTSLLRHSVLDLACRSGRLATSYLLCTCVPLAFFQFVSVWTRLCKPPPCPYAFFPPVVPSLLCRCRRCRRRRRIIDALAHVATTPCGSTPPVLARPSPSSQIASPSLVLSA